MKMKAEYDFSKAIKNPYYNASNQISMSLSQETLKYFKDLAKSKGVSFEEIIALFLNDCARKKLDIELKEVAS